MMDSFHVAIDGPAGSGKSSVAGAVSERFRMIHFDSGACYRAVACFLLKNGIKKCDEQSIEKKLRLLHLEYRRGALFINGEKVGEEIRTPQVSQFTSDISTLETVRDFVTSSIRDMIEGMKVVMDGRDIGTVVLPNADLKIFLTASPEERARRRLKDWDSSGIDVEYEEVLNEIKERDDRDSSRKLSPLKPAEDALTIDTTNLSFEEVVDKISNKISEKRTLAEKA